MSCKPLNCHAFFSGAFRTKTYEAYGNIRVKPYQPCTDKQNALRRECTFKIEIVLEIGVAGANIYLKITVLALSDGLAGLAQSVRPLRMIIDFYQ